MENGENFKLSKFFLKRTEKLTPPPLFQSIPPGEKREEKTPQKLLLHSVEVSFQIPFESLFN